MPFTLMSASHSHAPLWLIIPILILLVIGWTLSIYRLRRGGPGFAVGWVPRPLRGKLNAWSKKRGWQEPYDESGNRNPNRTRL